MQHYFYRTLTIQVKPSNPIYKFLDDLTFKAKNLYNQALYTERQIYFQYQKFLSNFEMYKLLSDTEAFKALPAQECSEILKMVYTELKSFQAATKEYNRHPEKFKARPKLPKYKHKTKGRYTLNFGLQQLRFKDGYIILPKKLDNHKIKLPKHINPEGVQCLRVVPQNQRIKIEIIYNKPINIPNIKENLKHIAGLDLGIDNFAAIAVYGPNKTPLLLNGKGLKSYNKYFNKRLAYLQSRAKLENNQYTTKRIQRLYNKRSNYFNTWMHTASKRIVQYLTQNQVGHLIIGINKGWKQESSLSKQANQTFIQIPYQQFINILTYKAQEQGITVYHQEESYTSGTSFLDNEPPTKDYYNKSRRIHRGLFRSNQNQFINADINAAYQIIKKVFPTARYSLPDHGILGCNTHPVKLTIKSQAS